MHWLSTESGVVKIAKRHGTPDPMRDAWFAQCVNDRHRYSGVGCHFAAGMSELHPSMATRHFRNSDLQDLPL
jgi:hypothetical protein